jgi:hypothetical protein
MRKQVKDIVKGDVLMSGGQPTWTATDDARERDGHIHVKVVSDAGAPSECVFSDPEYSHEVRA